MEKPKPPPAAPVTGRGWAGGKPPKPVTEYDLAGIRSDIATVLTLVDRLSKVEAGLDACRARLDVVEQRLRA